MNEFRFRGTKREDSKWKQHEKLFSSMHIEWIVGVCWWIDDLTIYAHILAIHWNGWWMRMVNVNVWLVLSTLERGCWCVIKRCISSFGLWFDTYIFNDLFDEFLWFFFSVRSHFAPFHLGIDSFFLSRHFTMVPNSKYFCGWARKRSYTKWQMPHLSKMLTVHCSH